MRLKKVFAGALAAAMLMCAVAVPATADCPWLRLTMVILKCGHGIGITPVDDIWNVLL